MATDAAYHGIFTIPCTPFHDDGRLDEDGLARVVDFCCRCRAHGLVWPVLASEFYTLSDGERMRGYRIVVEAAAGRAPVVAGVAGTSVAHAVELAEAAGAAGVDAVIAVPPYTVTLSSDEMATYYQRIAEAGGKPIMIQNAAFFGSPMTPAFVARLAREIDLVQYVKEEVPPALHRISEVVGLREPAIRGVFGGAGGLNLIEELRRGASGNMPACEWTDVLVAIYETYRGGDEEAARALHRRFLPAASMERLLGMRFAKEVLVRRGVIQSATMRIPSPALDAEDEHELERLLAEIADLLVA